MQKQVVAAVASAASSEHYSGHREYCKQGINVKSATRAVYKYVPDKRLHSSIYLY